ncbi:hypothetical protein H8K90_01245 [Winogradskyella echinorum]|uniref:Uncharacterized protein n=1 Tax=Winogradskyella echinorum TaxID=538189 RepID=A0ABR6XWW8_9FLAO|nr:hypothetical protein [Winogradskyella echinorum]MBC3844990.1 hypothetical protein [Winogradskyella echinorum]MBC5749338.1 hypothetical protein [Winogradskyella echinorum]
MRYIYLLFILCCFSCNNERVLLLPEIENAEVTEVLDVSPAYIFYDETQPDSALLNRKNLISTTNWLVNVDKRLTLRQAIPHIKFLQEKKRNAKMHKNENAKNYFTCNDTSIGSLGFLEFTDVNYAKKDSSNYWTGKRHLWSRNHIEIHYINENDIFIEGIITESIQEKSKSKEIVETITGFIKNDTIKLILNFNQKLSFQDYISLKSELLKIKTDKIIIDTNEFIY